MVGASTFCGIDFGVEISTLVYILGEGEAYLESHKIE